MKMIDKNISINFADSIHKEPITRIGNPDEARIDYVVCENGKNYQYRPIVEVGIFGGDYDMNKTKYTFDEFDKTFRNAIKIAIQENLLSILESAKEVGINSAFHVFLTPNDKIVVNAGDKHYAMYAGPSNDIQDINKFLEARLKKNEEATSLIGF